MSKIIKSFKLFEELVNKPIKKLPTDKAIHWNYLLLILEENGIDPQELVKGQINTGFCDFCFKKCSGNLMFPNKKDMDNSSYKDFIFGESVFLLPEKYDSSDDLKNYNKIKKDYLDKMLDFSIKMGKSSKEQEEFVKNAEKHTNFGPNNYDWVNKSLKILHDKLGEYYKDGNLRVWFPFDADDDGWEIYDYPHRYDTNLDRPNGIYYLSDIEKYIDDKYGIKDDLFYDFIINNNYIECRYWERVWSLRIENNTLKKRNFGKYGMEPTENITHILNIIEKDFKNDINGEFPIYIDYYKKIELKQLK